MAKRTDETNDLPAIKHRRDCADDCSSDASGWHVADGGDGRYYVIFTHDTESFDSDGEHVGYGASFQGADDFSSREAAERWLASELAKADGKAVARG